MILKGRLERSTSVTTPALNSAPKFLRLLAHIVDQLVAQNAIRKAREILHHGGQGKLPAGLVAVNDQRLQIGARGIDRGGKARAAAADNDTLCIRIAPGI